MFNLIQFEILKRKKLFIILGTIFLLLQLYRIYSIYTRDNNTTDNPFIGLQLHLIVFFMSYIIFLYSMEYIDIYDIYTEVYLLYTGACVYLQVSILHIHLHIYVHLINGNKQQSSSWQPAKDAKHRMAKMLDNAKARLRNDSKERTIRVEQTMTQMNMAPSE